MEWISILELTPNERGRYEVASSLLQEVAQATWKPRLKKWTFPSAAMAFTVTHWAPLPKPPIHERHTQGDSSK